jgi:rubrerythrin
MKMSKKDIDNHRYICSKCKMNFFTNTTIKECPRCENTEGNKKWI